MKTRAFDRVVIIMFENEYRNYVRRNPYMRALAKQGIEMGSYFGVMHPSNPNYVASIAGEICNITADPMYYTLIPSPYPTAPGPQPFQKETIVDRIREKGLEWGAYMESYSTVEFPPQLAPVMSTKDPSTVDAAATVRKTILDYPPYLNVHNPFVRFQSITGNDEQWKRIGTIYDFLRDAVNGTLPEYSWITPDIWSDGHWLSGSYDEPGQRAPALIDQLAKWLENFFSVLNFPGKRSLLPPRTLVVVTFDEADFEKAYQTAESFGSGYDGPNQVYTVLLGDTIPPGRIEREGYNHYSLLKTIEKNFALRDLGKNDVDANWFRFLWDERFRWGAAVDTPISRARHIAAAGMGNVLHVVDGEDSLSHRTFSGRKWSGKTAVPAPQGATAIEMAACGDELVLVCQAGGALSALTYAGDAWSVGATIVDGAAGSFALTAFVDYGDQTEKLMLAWQTSDNGIQSQVYAGGTWSEAIAVGQQTDGDMVLAALGPSLYLIHKAVGSNQMNVVSYNTADFNVVTAASGDDNTTRDAWSPSEFPVAHFGFGPNRSTPGEREPLLRPYTGVAPFVAATLDGVIHLAHRGVVESRVKTETFSISGILTPLSAVDYNTDAVGNSNGFGTLAEAGWSIQVPIAGARNARGGAMAMARFGSQVALLFQPQIGGPLRMSLGAYAAV